MRVEPKLGLCWAHTLLISIQFQSTSFNDPGLIRSENSDRNVTPAGRCNGQIDTSARLTGQVQGSKSQGVSRPGGRSGLSPGEESPGSME
jgi:hypothetical protein